LICTLTVHNGSPRDTQAVFKALVGGSGDVCPAGVATDLTTLERPVSFFGLGRYARRRLGGAVTRWTDVLPWTSPGGVCEPRRVLGSRPRHLGVSLSLAASLALQGCGADVGLAPDDAAGPDVTAPDVTAPDVTAPDVARDASVDVVRRDASPDARGDASMEPATDVGRDAPAPAPTAANVLALTRACTPLAGAPRYARDTGGVANIPLCTLRGAVFWHADMDIDCDGGRTRVCRADPSYLPDTSAVTSTGAAIDAETVPFIVVPLAGNGLDYGRAGFQLGSVALVIYGGRMAYAVFADEGPHGIIGEGSYALARALGIDPDPSTGGADDGVTFVLFTGGASVVMRNEDPAEAVRLGTARATELLRTN
jgi:hypothetical protein